MMIGTVVQAVSEVSEELPTGETLVHAEPGDLGRVISLTDDPDWVDVHFDRSGTITVAHASELAFSDSRSPISGTRPVPWMPKSRN